MAKTPVTLLRIGNMRTGMTAVVTSPPVSEKTKLEPLYRRLTEGSVAETLDKWSVEGGAVTTPHLMKHARALCKYRLHKQALEVMDWMGEKGLEMSNGSHAFCLGLLSKVKGIDLAENYFFSLPDFAKDQRTYRALLYCYCRKRMIDKAISLYEKMKERNLASSTIVYNNMMSLYTKISQHEKVPDLFREMKESNIPPDNCSYRILMKSHASMNDINSVERAVQDMEGSGVPLDWFTYCSLAEIYNSVNLFEKSEIALKKAELVMDGRDLRPIPFLIKLYAEARNPTEVKKVWRLLKVKSSRPNNEHYLVMLQALRKLDDMDALKNCFKEWEFGHVNYDTRVVNVMIEAYLDKNMVKEAEVLQEMAASQSVQDK